MTKLSNIKNIYKFNPKVLLKKPWFVFYLPLLFVNIVWNRLKFDEAIVYFVDTNINDYLSSKELNEINILEVNKITSFQQFQILVEKRLSEDLSMDRSYYYLCQKRFESGAFAYVLYINGNPVSYIFIVTEKVKISQVNYDMKIPKDTFVFIDLYTFNTYRGHGYYQKLYDAAILKMNRIGNNHFWCWLMAHNQTSIKAHCKLGINNVTKVIKRKKIFGFSKINVKETNLLLNELILTNNTQK